ncbi:signal transduction histidine kinase [Neobacillus niacini]|uniref:sensor histidine kinase n=1 Tax=Neobacillus niacini TaxID=86668 RepID=UPI00285F5720|nr:HAMP domain-containing sensor histidine kinase [Neobacillus niacini]MDR7078286.1 signal transduction histidine kinase [Neobacillus niacini]
MKKLKESEASYRELAEKYEGVINSLEDRVNEEVEKNRQKDLFLIQHSWLAAKGELIDSIGHQWRQPLNHLSLLIQDVQEALQFGEINEQYIYTFTKESMSQIHHMSRTIHDYRKFYQPNIEKCAFSVADSVEDALSIFSSNLKDHHIHVNFNYRGQPMAFGYPNEYSQVVLNILMNAKDAFVTNEVKNRRLDILICTKGSFVIVEVTDNGGGIEPALLSKVFDPYFTTKRHGTGIGLYLTKMIIENMNGRVQVENTDHGARFTLSVPKVVLENQTSLISV